MHKINGAVLSRYYVSSMLQKLSSVLCIYLVVITLHGHSHPSMLVFNQMIPCIPKKINLIPRRSQAVRQACEEQVSSVLLSLSGSPWSSKTVFVLTHPRDLDPSWI